MSESLYGGATHRRITIRDLLQAKQRSEKWAMLTSYEQMTAGIFDEAGIPVLLVGDSAGNNFLGEENTIPVTVDEMLPLGPSRREKFKASPCRRRPPIWFV